MRQAAVLFAVCCAAASVLVAQQAPPQSGAPPSSTSQPPAQATPGQQPPPANQGQQPPVFRGGANLVRVDATVTDKRGNPVPDLTKDDFDVREDNIPQTIQTIKLVETNGAAPDDDTSLDIRSPAHAAAEAARDEIRVFVIFWDEYHIGQMIPALRARDVLTDFVQTAFGPTDLVALMDQLTPTDAIRFTRNRRELADDVHQLKGRQGVYIPPRSAIEEAQLSRGGGVETVRAQVTASALESTIAYLGTLKEGRKSILLVTQTIGQLSPDGPQATYDWLSSVVKSANANNTSIYVLDPRGLEMNARRSDVLAALAQDTGGRIFNQNYPAAALRDVVRNASAFYLLGYASSQNPVDGKFHQIRVSVKRPGLEVKARTGYIAPSLTQMEHARTEAAKEDAPPEITRALSAIVDAPHLPAPGDLWAGAARGSAGAAQVSVVWTPRHNADTATPPRPIAIHATTDSGQVLFDGPLTDNRADFAAPPGPLHIRRDLLDADGSVADKLETTLTVPDFDGGPLVLTTPVLYRAATPADLHTIQSAANPTPYAGRQFDRTDRIFIRFDALGSAAAGATVSVALLGRHGAKLADLPLTRSPRGYQIDLPVAAVGRGEYVISIAAVNGPASATALVAIRVGSQ